MSKVQRRLLDYTPATDAIALRHSRCTPGSRPAPQAMLLSRQA